MKNENIMNQYENYKTTYEFLAKTVARIIKELLLTENIKFSSIVERVKDYKSLEGKIERKKNKYSDIKEITDIAGIRIITYYSDDVDRISDLIKKEFNIDIENSIDKRETLDSDRFGYLSLHYIAQMSNERLALTEYSSLNGFKFEIQIRSILQHTWAEIEHDLGYKSDFGIPKDIRRNFSRLAGLLEIADKEFKEIRDKLGEYKKDVEKQLANDKNNVLLDVVSLSSFIENNNEIKDFYKKICDIVGNVKISKSNYASSLKMLNYLDITTINELNNLIKNNKDLAYKIAVKYLEGDKYNSLPKDITILYLCYAELIIKNYSDCKVKDYLNENKFDVDDAFESLKKVWSEIINNQD